MHFLSVQIAVATIAPLFDKAQHGSDDDTQRDDDCGNDADEYRSAEHVRTVNG